MQGKKRTILSGQRLVVYYQRLHIIIQTLATIAIRFNFIFYPSGVFLPYWTSYYLFQIFEALDLNLTAFNVKNYSLPNIKLRRGICWTKNLFRKIEFQTKSSLLFEQQTANIINIMNRGSRLQTHAEARKLVDSGSIKHISTEDYTLWPWFSSHSQISFVLVSILLWWRALNRVNLPFADCGHKCMSESCKSRIKSYFDHRSKPNI